MSENTIHPRENENEEWQLGEIEAGIADLEAGQEVGHEEVARWLSSWGTIRETAPPAILSRYRDNV